jgi:hypothetical protein
VVETAEGPNPSAYEAVIREMMEREDELTNQRMTWMAAFNGLLFAGLGFAWDKSSSRSLTDLFCILGSSVSFLTGFALFLAARSQRRLLFWWRRMKPKDYDGPGVMGAEPWDKRGYTMYIAPWTCVAFIFFGSWLWILHIVHNAK